MVKLRLKRIGKRKQPYYRIVAAHVSVARNGRALAEVGFYDPMHASVKIDEERAIEWLNKGAQMSETVADLFHSQGVLARWKGAEGRVRDDALTGDKPKRRRKKAAAEPVQPTEPVEQEEVAPVEQAAAEPEAAESAEPAEQDTAEAAEPAEQEEK
ncbi:MAG: 30S ribosomal protein S16 [Gemmatimonadetes bacterium]|nr:30S ribosomal protein S16 [Gemmatimonadota bacterium]MDE2736330.1 30S ribosomal protein S16 [Gemmatimonadota bacterium]